MRRDGFQGIALISKLFHQHKGADVLHLAVLFKVYPNLVQPRVFHRGLGSRLGCNGFLGWAAGADLPCIRAERRSSSWIMALGSWVASPVF